MDKLNDFYKIIQNKYDESSISKNGIYDEIMMREKDMKETIDRVIEFKDRERLDKKLFINEKIGRIYTNTFKVLNDIMDELTKINKVSYNNVLKIIGKDQRQIYLGIFMVVIAIFLALIEISDAL